MAIDREELAWAAGFFDGEGTTHCRAYPTGRIEVRITVAQTDMRPLTRLRDAVGFGNINGPYMRKSPNHQPIFVYAISTHEKVQAFIAMVWKWLSDVKREQATRALLAAAAYERQHQTWKGLQICKRGHPMDGPGADLYYYTRKDGLTVRQCRTCRVERRDRQAEIIRLALEGGQL
jgi:hypothetical protein